MKTIIAIALGILLVGMTAGSCLVVGFQAGRWWGEWEMNYLMDVPQGGIVLSHRTGAYWHKMDNNTMRFVRIPNPRQARATQMFPRRERNEKATDKPSDSASGDDKR
jgi:hypothetical protein